ncbi:MAG TPA: squalene/phytoene synthase family protein, partial [Pseudomonadota bacterium]|nr:squalene/phytoene synthase family protein [Pseudomonadota bacterium]
MGQAVDGQKTAAAVTTQSRSNFFFAFLFMPKPRREAIYAVYAYCRVIDDIVDSDDPVAQKESALAQWEDELRAEERRAVGQAPCVRVEHR